MRTLIYACSVYQLFNAINIRINVLKDDKVDILLSDIIQNQEKIGENLRKTGLFENVYTSKGKFIARQEYKHTRGTVYGYRLFPDRILSQAGLRINERYDRYYFATFDDFICFIYLKLIQKNKNLEVCMYEDGGITYTYTHQRVNGVEERLAKLLRKDFLGMRKIPNLVYETELMTYRTDAPVYKIPKISKKDKEFINAVNLIFDFSEAPVALTKYIFFEESYLADGLKNNDEELIRLCFDITKGQMSLKPHPRNPYNRFEHSDIKLFNSNIPWEIFCLNTNLSDKVLLTVNSNAAISPHILFEDAPKTILLFNLFVGESNLQGKPEFDLYYKKILELFPNDIFAPKTVEELNQLLGR